MALPQEDEKQFSIGGFQGIKKIRGLLVSIDVVDPPAAWENAEKQVVQVCTEDTIVLEMFGDEELFSLKDGKFNFYISYAKEGANPSANGVYRKCWYDSAAEMGRKPSGFIGEYVTLEKQARLLFSQYKIDPDTKKPMLDEDGQKIHQDVLSVTKEGLPSAYCFVPDDSADSENLKVFIKGRINGLNKKAALRELVGSDRIKQFPEFKQALQDGTLAEMLGMDIVEGKFRVKEENV